MLTDRQAKNLADQQARRADALRTLRQLRQDARDEIERLLAFLDESDIDPDLEEGGDEEPSLGFVDAFPGRGMTAGTLDLEEDAGDSPECDPAESGIADIEGLVEQGILRHGAVE